MIEARWGSWGGVSTRLEVRNTKKIEDVHYEWKIGKIGETNYELSCEGGSLISLL